MPLLKWSPRRPLPGEVLYQRRPVIAVRLDQYLEAPISRSALQVYSGEMPLASTSHYDILQKRIVARLQQDLEPNFQYYAVLDVGKVVSLAGEAPVFATVVGL